MKLYTEEQLRYVFDRARATDDYERLVWESCDNILDHGELTPIELPSDEDIDISSGLINTKEMVFPEHQLRKSFSLGAKWMRDKIQGGNK